jgi:tRNA-2-methylthio-N6-dimethylallyladenosine synthase
MPQRVYIETVGCQMNVLDSELVAAELLQAGYELTDAARKADVILFNTCSVRQHAEDKIHSALGRLKHVKEQRPEKIIGVLGCMAQKDQLEILRRAPHVDLVVGPGQLGRIARLLEQVAAGKGPILAVSDDRAFLTGLNVTVKDTRPTMATCKDASLTVTTGRNAYRPVQFDPPRVAGVRPIRQQALVRIMFGCDKLCSYCIVPRVRGSEQNRPAEEIETEVRRLVDDGCLEVTLLGQTVNSYRDKTEGVEMRLADLLYRLDKIAGLRRLKFVTNHPRHITDALLQAVRDLPKASPYLHVPAQSGSNRVLQRMQRGYTMETYRAMLARIRETVPAAAVTSDFIVGFCGESEEDFQQTVALVRDARFKNSFIFKYSTRPGTKAAELYIDDVPEDVKRRRNNELLAIQNAISLEDNRPFLGRQVEILVEGPSKVSVKKQKVATGGRACSTAAHGCDAPSYSFNNNPADDSPVQLVGRTACDRIVVFDGSRALTGRILPVEIERVEAMTLYGRSISGT